MGLDVLLIIADIAPVAVGPVAVKRTAVRQHAREDVLRKIDVFPFRDVIEYLRLKDIDTGVYSVAKDLAPCRLLQKPLDPTVIARDYDPEFEGGFHPLQRDRRLGALLPMKRDQLGQ